MPRYVTLKRRATGEVLLPAARWCVSFLCRLRGLMFRSSLKPGEAIILVEWFESRAGTTMHMFFVPFAIAMVWIDNAGRVVDKVEALPWRPSYVPRAPARYILETAPDFLGHISLGDEVDFEDAPFLGAAPAGR